VIQKGFHSRKEMAMGNCINFKTTEC